MARTNFNGWVKVQRKFMNWEFYDDPKAVKLFVHLLLCAAPESCVIDGVNINAGETKTSYRKLAKELKFTDREIRTYINKLRKNKTIEILTSRNYSIVKLTKYNLYQKNDTRNDTRKALQIGASKGYSDTPKDTQKNDTRNDTQKSTRNDTQNDTRKAPQTGTSKGYSDTPKDTKGDTQSDAQSDTPIYNKNNKKDKNINISSSSVVVSEEEEEEEILKKLKIRFFYENVKNYEQEAEQMLQYWKDNNWKQNNGNKINVRRLPKFQWRPRNDSGRDFGRFLAVLSDYLRSFGKYEDCEYLKLYKRSKLLEDGRFCVECFEQFKTDVETKYTKQFMAAMKSNGMEQQLYNMVWRIIKQNV